MAMPIQYKKQKIKNNMIIKLTTTLQHQTICDPILIFSLTFYHEASVLSKTVNNNKVTHKNKTWS